MKKIILFSMIFINFSLVSCTNAGTDHSHLQLKYKTSADPQKQQTLIYDFIWQSFIALNWPNVPLDISEGKISAGLRGKPDRAMLLSSMSGAGALPLTVWETYKSPYEIFTPPESWAQSGVWNSVRNAPPDFLKPRPQSNQGECLEYAPVNKGSSSFSAYLSESLQPYFYPHATGPLYDQQGCLVLYQVAVNRAFFRYVRHFKYYNAGAQREAVKAYIQGKPGAFQRPPYGNATETSRQGYLHTLPKFQQTGFVDVKAAWRVLDPTKKDEIARYLHREQVVPAPNGKTRVQLMGLVALHILRWTPNGYNKEKGIQGSYIASTFEHIDNVKKNTSKNGKNFGPTFNNGKSPDAEQLEYGFSGATPGYGDKPVNLYRAKAQAISAEIQERNNFYQRILSEKNTVLQYYQLIGTQNRHEGPVSFKPESRNSNGPQGPITGVITNTNNLVNSVLESYSQKNFACILCHIKARPIGVKPAKGRPGSVPDKAFQDDYFKILTFLLQDAQEPESE